MLKTPMTNVMLLAVCMVFIGHCSGKVQCYGGDLQHPCRLFGNQLKDYKKWCGRCQGSTCLTVSYTGRPGLPDEFALVCLAKHHKDGCYNNEHGGIECHCNSDLCNGTPIKVAPPRKVANGPPRKAAATRHRTTGMVTCYGNAYPEDGCRLKDYKKCKTCQGLSCYKVFASDSAGNAVMRGCTGDAGTGCLKKAHSGVATEECACRSDFCNAASRKIPPAVVVIIGALVARYILA